MTDQFVTAAVDVARTTAVVDAALTAIERRTQPVAEPAMTTVGDRLPIDCVLVPIEIRPTTAVDRGVFAAQAIAAGTICVVFGGFVTPRARFDELPEARQRHSLQIGDDLYLVCDTELGAGDLVNHSCDPTLHFAGEITLVARRDIAAGEQLTYDYGTSDSTPYDEFECECGTARCRMKVTGEDWMRPELQREYTNAFSPYLQRRIDLLGT